MPQVTQSLSDLEIFRCLHSKSWRGSATKLHMRLSAWHLARQRGTQACEGMSRPSSQLKSTEGHGKSSWLLQLACCPIWPSSAEPLSQLLILSSGTETAEADVAAARCAWRPSPGSLASCSAAQLGKHFCHRARPVERSMSGSLESSGPIGQGGVGVPRTPGIEVQVPFRATSNSQQTT